MEKITTRSRIGMIGLGVMGRSIAANILKAGYTVNLFTRSKASAEAVMEQGGVWCNSPAEVAKISDVLITIVGYPKDVEEVYFGSSGIFEAAKVGTILIDMTTSSPKLAEKIFSEAQKRGFHALDAPVSGGDLGARQGTLSIMIGGEQEVFDSVHPLLETIGKNIVFQGKSGSGQHTKMCNQIVIASGMIGVCEGLLYAKQSGLDPATVLQSIQSGAAGSWSLSNLAPRIIDGNFDPGFYIKHFIKDMRIALDTAHELHLTVPGLELALSLYEKLGALGFENLGTQGLYKLYEMSLKA